LWTSDSKAGVKTEKSGGVAGGEGECGDDVVGLPMRDRRSLDILPVKKEAKLSASEVPGEVVQCSCVVHFYRTTYLQCVCIVHRECCVVRCPPLAGIVS